MVSRSNQTLWPCQQNNFPLQAYTLHSLGLVIIPSNHISLPQGPVGGPVPVGGDAGVPRRLPLPHGPGPHGPGPGLHSPHPRGQGLAHSQVMAAQAEQPRENFAVLVQMGNFWYFLE